MSQANDPVAARIRDQLARGDVQGAADALAKLIAADRRADWAYNDLITLLATNGRRAEAEQVARRALADNPSNAGAHDRFGSLLSDQHDLPAGEWHFRRALELGGPRAGVLSNLALNLMQQGRTAESEAAFAEADALAPANARILAHWSKLREVQGDLEGALSLLDAAESASSPAAVDLLRAQYLARAGRVAQAVALLEAAPQPNGDSLLERGRLYERLGRYEEAWRDWVEGKRRLAAERGSLRYDAPAVRAYYRALTEFVVPENVARLPQAPRRRDVPQPVFILGAPRSGTTLMEQVIASHSAVRPGGERPWADELRQLTSRLLAEGGAFPGCLAAAWTADRRHIALLLRDHYLARAEAAGLFTSGGRYFTDKMPFNEIYLPLLRMAFPESPMVYLRRDPRDVCVSMLAHHLSHGFHCGYRIEDIVSHVAATAGLAARFLAVYGRDTPLVLRYEDLIADQEGTTRALLGHVGLPFEESCLRFHANPRYAPTPSYDRVTRPLDGGSIGRHRRFAAQLVPYAAQLEPVLTAGGYQP